MVTILVKKRRMMICTFKLAIKDIPVVTPQQYIIPQQYSQIFIDF